MFLGSLSGVLRYAGVVQPMGCASGVSGCSLLTPHQFSPPSPGREMASRERWSPRACSRAHSPQRFVWDAAAHVPGDRACRAPRVLLQPRPRSPTPPAPLFNTDPQRWVEGSLLPRWHNSSMWSWCWAAQPGAPCGAVPTRHAPLA